MIESPESQLNPLLNLQTHLRQMTSEICVAKGGIAHYENHFIPLLPQVFQVVNLIQISYSYPILHIDD